MIAYLTVVCPECGMRHELKITESTARRIVSDMDAAPCKDELGRTFESATGHPADSLGELLKMFGMT